LLRLQIHTYAGAAEVETTDPGQRISDWLDAAETTVALREPPAQANDPSSPDEGWEQLRLDDLLVVVPPPQPADPARRLHRPGQAIRVAVGPYLVTGTAHVPPGTEAVAYLGRHGSRFLALTGATIERLDNSAAPVACPVAVVNLQQASSVRPAATKSG